MCIYTSLNTDEPSRRSVTQYEYNHAELVSYAWCLIFALTLAILCGRGCIYLILRSYIYPTQKTAFEI